MQQINGSKTAGSSIMDASKNVMVLAAAGVLLGVQYIYLSISACSPPALQSVSLTLLTVPLL